LLGQTMGRAEDLYRRLVDGGEKVLDEFIADRQSEELFLGFKRSADNAAGSKLHNTDRANLGKAISGFANSEGGVVVWGVECSPTLNSGDVASAKLPLHNPKRFVSWLEGAVSGCTVPPNPGVRHHAILVSSNAGYVVTHIPRSGFAPTKWFRDTITTLGPARIFSPPLTRC